MTDVSRETTSVPAYLASAMMVDSAEAEQIMDSQNWNPQMRRLTTGTAVELGDGKGPGQDGTDLLVFSPGFATVGPMGASAAIPPVRRHGRP